MLNKIELLAFGLVILSLAGFLCSYFLRKDLMDLSVRMHAALSTSLSEEEAVRNTLGVIVSFSSRSPLVGIVVSPAFCVALGSATGLGAVAGVWLAILGNPVGGFVVLQAFTIWQYVCRTQDAVCSVLEKAK